MEQITNEKELIEYIKFRISEEGLSQRELGRLTGYTGSEISRVLNNKRKSKHNVVIKLCKILCIPTDILYKIYPDYIIKPISSDINLQLYYRINKLGETNQEKVFKYIDFLLDEEIENINKESVNNIIKCMIKKNVEK